MGKARTVLVQINSLELGGTQINAIDLARAVEAHGFRSVLFGPMSTVPKSGPNVMELARARGVPLEGYSPEPTFVSRALALNARAKRVGADIIHVYGTWGDPRSAYWGPCLAGRRPFVQTVYEMEVDPATYRNSSLIIGTGYLRDELAERPGPTTLVSPPVDLDADSPSAVSGEKFRASLGELGSRPLVAVVSRLALEMKSYPVEVAIRAMTHLTDTDAVLVVVGSGSEEQRLREIGHGVNAMAGRTMVTFIGALADPRPVYAAADIMLGMGGSAARSLAFAAPLVVHGEGGTAELFDENSAASLFRRSFWSKQAEPDGAAVLAALLRKLLADPARRKQLGQFGRNFAIENFGLTAMAERLAAVYESSFAHYGPRAWMRDFRQEVPHLMQSLSRRLPGGR
jgi:glycosyltransferase involved in cell wall biosynthesis